MSNVRTLEELQWKQQRVQQLEIAAQLQAQDKSLLPKYRKQATAMKSHLQGYGAALTWAMGEYRDEEEEVEIAAALREHQMKEAN